MDILIQVRPFVLKADGIKKKYRAFNESSEEYNKILSQAFRKYGIENFTFEILEECEPTELNDKEMYYISLYNTYFNGYNETTGGQGSSNYCAKISREQILEIYELLLNSEIPQNDIARQYKVGYDTISNINQGKTRRLEGYTFPLRVNKKEYFYIECGAKISSANTFRCAKCHRIHLQKVPRPTKEELYDLLLKNKGNFTKVGQKYNVTDNAIRKWCKSYNLPYHSKDYCIKK